MNKVFSFFCIFISFICLDATAFAQQELEISQDSIKIIVGIQDSLVNDSNFLEKLPGLTTFIDSAIVHSPILKRQDAEILIKDLSRRTVNQEWLKYIGLYATTNYGVFDNFTADQSQQMTVNSITTGNAFRWSVGVTVNGAPIYDLLNKSTNNKIKRLEYQQEIYQKEDLTIQLRQLVIQQYNNLLLSYKMMKISNENLYSNYTQLLMIEQQFKEGEVSVSDLAGVREMYYKSEMAYESYKTAFFQNYLLMKEICGFQF